MSQGGDVTPNEHGKSIYGNNFTDENLNLKHYKRGMLTMANKGPDTNNSEFMITFGEAPWLDGYHNVVGEIVEGEEVLKALESVGTRTGVPTEEIKIEDCGEVKH